jgi:hypothetical protein
MLDQLSARMTRRSAALLASIDRGLDRIVIWWLVLSSLASAARFATAPHSLPIAAASNLGAYALLVLAPAASTILALRWFTDGRLQPQPSTRLARVGRWVTVSPADAQRHPLYGCSGIMVSLLIGMMLNVPVRAAEYLAAMPPVPASAPGWLSALHFSLTLDAVLFGSLYMVAFVAALRHVPLFPRLLAAIWLGDLAMQLVTAKLVVAASPVPGPVADALHRLLYGNIEKTLISIAVWLPYLLLSARVNITYRSRVGA